MSRLLDGVNQYLEIDQAVVATTPLTMACFFRSTDTANTQVLMSIVDSSVANHGFWLMLRGATGGDPVAARAYAGGLGTANSAVGYSLNIWQHACGVFVESELRFVLVDGGNIGTNVNNLTPAGLDRTSIGRAGDSTPDFYIAGEIEGAAIWNVALTRQEIWLHACGVPAPFIRPQNLIYWPLESAEDFEWQRRYDMAAFNTPGVGVHPPKVMEYWNKYHLRAATVQGTTSLVSWGRPNVWQATGRVPDVVGNPTLTTYAGYSVPTGD